MSRVRLNETRNILTHIHVKSRLSGLAQELVRVMKWVSEVLKRVPKERREITTGGSRSVGKVKKTVVRCSRAHTFTLRVNGINYAAILQEWCVLTTKPSQLPVSSMHGPYVCIDSGTRGDKGPCFLRSTAMVDQHPCAFEIMR